MIAAVIAMLLFATSSVAAHRSIGHLGPAGANFWRVLIATLVLVVYAHGFGGGLGGPALAWFLASGLVGYGLGDFGIFRALPLIGARLTSLLTQCLAAPIASTAEWMWLGTRLGARELIAGATILAGVALALAPAGRERVRLLPSPSPAPLPEAGSGSALPVSWAGIGFGFLAAFGQAIGAVLSRHGMQLMDSAGRAVDPMTISYQRILPGLAFGWLWWLASRRGGGDVPSSRVLPPARAWPWVLLNGVVGPCVGVIFYQLALHQQPTGIVMAIVALTPLFVIPLAILIEGERPAPRSIVGGCIAVAGAVVLVVSRV